MGIPVRICSLQLSAGAPAARPAFPQAWIHPADSPYAVNSYHVPAAQDFRSIHPRSAGISARSISAPAGDLVRMRVSDPAMAFHAVSSDSTTRGKWLRMGAGGPFGRAPGHGFCVLFRIRGNVPSSALPASGRVPRYAQNRASG